MNIGFAPTCDDKLFDSALRRNFNAGKLPIFRINPYKGWGQVITDHDSAGPMAGIGARGGGAGMQGGKPKEEICKLPWMKSAKMCQNTRRRRSVSANPMSVGFGKCQTDNLNFILIHLDFISLEPNFRPIGCPR